MPKPKPIIERGPWKGENTAVDPQDMQPGEARAAVNVKIVAGDPGSFTVRGGLKNCISDDFLAAPVYEENKDYKDGDVFTWTGEFYRVNQNFTSRQSSPAGSDVYASVGTDYEDGLFDKISPHTLGLYVFNAGEAVNFGKLEGYIAQAIGGDSETVGAFLLSTRSVLRAPDGYIAPKAYAPTHGSYGDPEYAFLSAVPASTSGAARIIRININPVSDNLFASDGTIFGTLSDIQLQNTDSDETFVWLVKMHNGTCWYHQSKHDYDNQTNGGKSWFGIVRDTTASVGTWDAAGTGSEEYDGLHNNFGSSDSLYNIRHSAVDRNGNVLLIGHNRSKAKVEKILPEGNRGELWIAWQYHRDSLPNKLFAGAGYCNSHMSPSGHWKEHGGRRLDRSELHGLPDGTFVGAVTDLDVEGAKGKTEIARVQRSGRIASCDRFEHHSLATAGMHVPRIALASGSRMAFAMGTDGASIRDPRNVGLVNTVLADKDIRCVAANPFENRFFFGSQESGEIKIYEYDLDGFHLFNTYDKDHTFTGCYPRLTCPDSTHSQSGMFLNADGSFLWVLTYDTSQTATLRGFLTGVHLGRYSDWAPATEYKQGTLIWTDYGAEYCDRGPGVSQPGTDYIYTASSGTDKIHLYQCLYGHTSGAAGSNANQFQSDRKGASVGGRTPAVSSLKLWQALPTTTVLDYQQLGAAGITLDADYEQLTIAYPDSAGAQYMQVTAKAEASSDE